MSQAQNTTTIATTIATPTPTPTPAAIAIATATTTPVLASDGASRSGMQLKIMRHTWGLDQVSFVSFFSDLRSHKKPYQGVEAGLIWLSQAQQSELKQVIEEQRFEWIAMVFTDTPFNQSDSVEAHVKEFERQCSLSLNFSLVRPILINVHSGRDSWSREQQEQYFTQVLHIAENYTVPVVHETHRGRILYNPWTTRDLLIKFPSLRLCADLSHWTCVAERMLDSVDCVDILKLVATRTLHIHARVGHEQGPQVTDPRAPEWAQHVQTFERWWTQIWNAQAQQGQTVTTVTPEYGPSPYQSLFPYTCQPVASLPEICDWAANRLQQLHNITME